MILGEESTMTIYDPSCSHNRMKSTQAFWSNSQVRELVMETTLQKGGKIWRKYAGSPTSSARGM